ncbi:MAG: ankyrin repeat domain-containing protein [Roseivirga sp.]
MSTLPIARQRIVLLLLVGVSLGHTSCKNESSPPPPVSPKQAQPTPKATALPKRFSNEEVWPDDLISKVQNGDAQQALRNVREDKGAINDPLPEKWHRGKTVAHLVAAEGDVSVVKALRQAGADFDRTDSKDNTAVHAAAMAGHAQVIEALDEAGANLNPQNKYGNTPLHKAAYAGNLRAVEALIKAKAELNKQDKLGYTALHKAILRKEGAVVEALVSASADLSKRASFGFTPLHDAVFAAEPRMVEVLLKAGADRNLVDSQGRTPLALAQARDPCHGPESTASTTQTLSQQRVRTKLGRKPRPKQNRRPRQSPEIAEIIQLLSGE